MPTGKKLVLWTPDDEMKLLHSIIAVHDLKLDYAKVAAMFGPNIPASCISAHMSKLRKKAASLMGGQAPIPATTNVNAKGFARGTTAAKKGMGNKRKRGGMLSDAVSDEESMADTGIDSEQEATPPETDDNAPTTPNNKRQKTIGGRVFKRASPRKTAKKDYKKIEDPFTELNDATDGDGEKVFGTDKSDSEDSQASDREFGGEQEKTAIIETEEAITEEGV